jgi:transcriptional regulator with XRE-family HTH domain
MVSLGQGDFHQIGAGFISPVWCFEYMNQIRHFREQLKLTQEQLAEKTNTTAQHISRLERSERRLTVTWMRRLAPALGVRPEDLMTENVIPPPRPGDVIRDEFEAIIVGAWRSMGPEQREIVMRVMGRPGYIVPPPTSKSPKGG